MYGFIRANQLDIMLALCAVCIMMTVMLLITRFIPSRRKWIITGMELVATFLLFFDRQAYIYSGDVSHTGYIMVRVSNFLVFFLTACVVFNFNAYLIDILNEYAKIKTIPARLKIVGIASVAEMILVGVSQFTGLYYSFDENNVYHRGPWFILCYLIPVIGPLVQYTVCFEYRKRFSRFINIALFLYIFVPIAAGIIQIYAYGISIVNMAMVLVSVSLYIFTYLDINEEVVRTHNIEMDILQSEQRSMKRLFEQTASSFMKAVEKKDEYAKGYSAKVADLARRIARESGKSEEECDEVYYAALLHDIGMVCLPDSVVSKTEEWNSFEYELIKQKPILSGEILSGITEYPYLGISARFSHEKFDGSGYPDGISGKDIPEISRIIYVADAYISMMSRKRFSEPMPLPLIREEFIKNAGTKYDPAFADILVRLMDSDVNTNELTEDVEIETELNCGSYRDSVSKGIEITNAVTKISFASMKTGSGEDIFSQPSIILFDSFDRCIHRDAKAIEVYKYMEYGELWFDGHSISTNVRNMRVETSESADEHMSASRGAVGDDSLFKIFACRYEDHLKLIMESNNRTVTAIAVLPNKARSAYIGITGENCYINGIKVEKTDEYTKAEDIPRIEDELDYTNRLVSDIPNLQIDRTRSASTEGIPIKEHLRLRFHSMTLPSATFIWHCPYIVLFYSKDRKVFGEGYREYAMVKFNGESDAVKDFARNKYVIEKNEKFPGWDSWKESCKQGMECEVVFRKKGNTVTMVTENLGISIENVTTINDEMGEVYAAISGDQVAVTDIRIR